METKIPSKIPKFFCDVCHYKTANKKDYNKHILTLKHIERTKRKQMETEISQQHYECECGKIYKNKSGLWKHQKETKCQKRKSENPQNGFVCLICNKSYNSRSGLWKHSKNCDANTNSSSNDVNDTVEPSNSELKEMFLQQQQENRELKQLLINQQEQHSKEIKELIPQIQQVTNITNNTNNTNNSNNRFNLNFFLNEQCKDAISIQNFIENLNIGLPELEHMGNVGYVQGMMSIFSSTLGAMDIYKRPLHCTDLKRETLYIKQGDTWKKDTEDKTELKKLIKTVEYKNYGSLRLWEREHPEAFECDTQDNIDYMRISNESLGGFDSTDAIKLGKIMKHIVKEVYIK